jgi:hypothetical protein
MKNGEKGETEKVLCVYETALIVKPLKMVMYMIRHLLKIKEPHHIWYIQSAISPTYKR